LRRNIARDAPLLLSDVETPASRPDFAMYRRALSAPIAVQ